MTTPYIEKEDSDFVNDSPRMTADILLLADGMC